MVRKSMWVAMAVLLACAPGALAYEYRIEQSNVSGFTYASELFGPGSGDSRLDYSDADPTLTLWTILSEDAEEEDVTADDEMEVTLTLANAVFSQNMRTSNLDVRVYDRAPGENGYDPVTSRKDRHMTMPLPVNVSRDSGGNAGEARVVFLVTAGQGWPANVVEDDASSTAISIEIRLPPLEGLNGRAVTASIEVDAGGGSGFMSSQDPGVTIESNGMGNVPGNLTSRITGSGVLRLTSPSTSATATATTGGRNLVPLIRFTPALTFSAAGGGTSDIDITGSRMLVEPTGNPRRAQSTLASVRVGVTDTSDDGPKQLGGNLFSIAPRQDGEGHLVVSVTGEFHAMGDQVWLDLNGNRTPDAGELLALSEGAMSGRFNLNQVAGDASSTGDSDEAERKREEGVATRNLIFLPNGTETLRPATYTSTFSVDFREDANSDKPSTTAAHCGGRGCTHTTRYFVQEGSNTVTIGDDLTRHAYAIPPLGHADEGTVRVKCETATACPLYLECDDSGGGSWFATMSTPIEPRSTVQLSSETIASALDVGEAGWTGRLSCTMMSTRDISLQVLTRSGGALINNTYVDN